MNFKLSKNIYIDPAYKAYYQDRLFDDQDSILNRDDTLAPYIRIKEDLMSAGAAVHTADFLLAQVESAQCGDYYSFGVLENYRRLALLPKIRLSAFVIFEPPVVAPHLYKALPELTNYFERVYIHNIVGDGYSLKDVDQSKLYKFYWPQPRPKVIEQFWNSKKRQKRIVIINGNHKPVSKANELYSARIEAMASLAELGCIDLYGRGWDRWWSRNSMWLPYWLNRKSIKSIYKGSCESKYEVLSDYEFALCFENMGMTGYVTEKIFDCLYSGAIPVYFGAVDINDLIPDSCYIDARRFASWKDLYVVLMSMSSVDLHNMRIAGRQFLESDKGMLFYNGLMPVFQVE
jgi:alpha(1,3/1,4) fucosyltransferase